MMCSDKCPIRDDAEFCPFFFHREGPEPECLYPALREFMEGRGVIKDCPTCKWDCMEGNDNPRWKLAHAHGKPTQYDNEDCRFYERKASDKKGGE